MTTYESIRGQIKTGDVFFTKSPAFFSRMIRLFTQSKVSHVGLFVIIENRIFCIETMEGKGCVMTLASQRLQEGFFWGQIDTNRTADDIVSDALDSVGRIEYDLVGALLALFIQTHSDREFCSEFVTRILGLEFPALNRGILPIDIVSKCNQFILI